MSIDYMSKKPLISIIVPIYNIERYVGMCIESLIKQSYENIEIILVDDGSTDRCPEICDLYEKKDFRIKVIHKPNGGLVSARIVGIEKAQGEYVGYVDGDDWVEPKFYENLLQKMIEYNTDVVIAGHSRDIFSKCVSIENNIEPGLYETNKLDKLFSSMISYGDFYKAGVSTYVWNKLFKKDLLLKFQLNVDTRITIGEDAAVVYPLLLSCKKVYIFNNYEYHYRQREDSMLKKNNSFREEAKKLKILYNYLLDNVDDNNNEKYNLKKQINDFILGLYLTRSGGIIHGTDNKNFPYKYDLKGKNVIIYSAGTFGQQLVNRINDAKYCNVVGWVDDDFWEYRRCCLDVDSVESINKKGYDYILIATINSKYIDSIKDRLIKLGVTENKILRFQCDDSTKKELLNEYLELNT